MGSASIQATWRTAQLKTAHNAINYINVTCNTVVRIPYIVLLYFVSDVTNMKRFQRVVTMQSKVGTIETSLNKVLELGLHGVLL